VANYENTNGTHKKSYGGQCKDVIGNVPDREGLAVAEIPPSCNVFLPKMPTLSVPVAFLNAELIALEHAHGMQLDRC
jgi:hypothetical protein